jgi:hypothetical protein
MSHSLIKEIHNTEPIIMVTGQFLLQILFTGYVLMEDRSINCDAMLNIRMAPYKNLRTQATESFEDLKKNRVRCWEANKFELIRLSEQLVFNQKVADEPGRSSV